MTEELLFPLGDESDKRYLDSSELTPDACVKVGDFMENNSPCSLEERKNLAESGSETRSTSENNIYYVII